MKKAFAVVFLTVSICILGLGLAVTTSYAKNTEETLEGNVYDLGEKDAYDLSLINESSGKASRFRIEGDISNVSINDGFIRYAVESGNLSITVDDKYGEELIKEQDAAGWHIVSDKTKTVDGTKVSQKIGTGAIIIQTSKDGKTWINADTITDFYNNMGTINARSINGEKADAFYKTTNVQITNGCYYRIIVAYKLEREIAPSKSLFVTVKNKEEKECVELYQFYAYDPSINRSEVLDTKNAYEFGDVYRVDSQDGFKNPEKLKSDDPHIDWSVGKFYVSGYTDVKEDGDIPIFLKVPGDRAALWFNLEQELDKCNGRTDVKVNYIDSGSDIYFETPTINNFGRGALIVRKTDKQNQKERQIYTNYLEASATVGANTRIDLFEEGDYEVALDYQLHYDKPFVFGRTSTKTLTYQILFKFKVRNGDISAFIRDVDTNQFITNANVAEHGFYIDVAQSQYLNMTIKREVLSDSMDGLVEDTKFSGVAKEGRHYTDEGIYTVTVKNLATNDSIEKRVYVGDRDILLVHMKTGISISEINERIAAGAYIDERGQIIDPEPIVEEETIDDGIEEAEEVEEASEEKVEASNVISEENIANEGQVPTEAMSSNTDNDGGENKKQRVNNVTLIVIISVFLILCVAIAIAVKKKNSDKNAVDKEDNKE